MGMGWKDVSGGEWSRRKCNCKKGYVIQYVSDHEESDYPPFDRDATYWEETTCVTNCEGINSNIKYDSAKHYR